MPSSGVQTCALDRKSTRLNSSHTIISYAVFCLKKNTQHPASPRHPSPVRPHQRASPRLPLRTYQRLPPLLTRIALSAFHFLLSCFFFLKNGGPPEFSPFPPPAPFRF